MTIPLPTSRRAAPAAAFALALAAAAASAQTPAAPVTVEVLDEVAALVNGQMISRSELDRQVTIQAERLGVPDDPGVLADLRRQVLNGMVDNTLILQVAEQRGMRVPDRYFEEWKQQTMQEMNVPDEEEFIRQVRLQGSSMEELRKQFSEGVLINEIRRQDIEERVTISEPEIEQRYGENIEDFVRAPQVRLSELVVHVAEDGEADAGRRIAEARELVVSGADFAEVARVRSESDSAESGGDLGLFRIGELDDVFREVVEGLEPGDVSEPLRIGSSLYLLHLASRTEESTIALDEVRNQIAESLYAEKLQTEMDRFVRELRENAIVEIRIEPAAGTTSPQ